MPFIGKQYYTFVLYLSYVPSWS